MPSSPRRDLIYDLLAPPLILATPFVSFISHNEYSYAAAEIWISLAGLLAVGLFCGLVIVLGGQWLRVLVTAGLLTLFVDLQSDWLDSQKYLRGLSLGLGSLLLCWLLREHLSRITTPAFATILVAGLVFQGGSSEWSVKARAQRAPAQAAPGPALPVVVHLIFDEFMGIEGIPPEVPRGTEVAHSLRSFLHANGFQVFGRAFSRFHRTDNALPNTLNYSSVPEEGHFTRGDQKHLVANRYFIQMHEKGHKINVYQPDYINFCAGYEKQIASCRTFLSRGIKPLETLPLPMLDKSELIWKNFGKLSVIWQTSISYYNRIRSIAIRNGYHFPEWFPGSPHLWSARGLQVLDIVARDAANAAPGDLYFAHLLIPHGPYVYDRSCNLRNPHDWEDRPGITNAASRAHRYALYLDQVECVQNRLGDIFDLWRREGVYDSAEIIIHGDHGSRLYLEEPTIGNKDDLQTSDYVDSFSTLWAVKSPGAGPKYDRSIVAIQDALAVVADDRPLHRRPDPVEEPYVLLRNMKGSEMIRRPMPVFGEIPAE